MSADPTCDAGDVAMTHSSETEIRGLRLFNALMVPVHLVQGLLMLALSTDFSLPVTTSFLKFDEAAEKLVTDDNTLFDLRL
jgi:hypothetical protein